MAILYTDNLLGDNANSGLTSSAPKKSINAALQISSNGDEIRVAGGSFSQLPGFFTNSLRGSTLTTSQDWTVAPYGLTAGDCIAFDTTALDGWPIDYNAWMIQSTTPTTIVLRTNMWLPIGHGTFSCYKLSSHHYSSATASQIFETISSFTASNVLVSGGWNSTFDTQWGWTGVRAGVPASTNSSNLFTTTGIAKTGVVFDKFLFNNTGFNNSSSSTNLTIWRAIHTGGVTLFSTSNGFVGSPTYSNMILVKNGCAASSIAGSTNTQAGGQNINIDHWISVSNQANDNLIDNGSPIAMYDTVKFRTNGAASGTQAKGLNCPTNSFFATMYINNLDIYMYATASYQFYGGNNLLAVNNINFYRPDNTSCGVHVLTGETSVQPMQHFSKTSGIIEDFQWMYPSSFTNFFPSLQNYTYFSVKDTEGFKVVDGQGNVRFADSSTYSVGTQSMRINTLKNPVGFTGKKPAYYIGTTLKPSTTFTLSISAKTNVASLVCTPFIYGSGFNFAAGFVPNLTLSNITLTSSWQTFTFSVNPTNIALTRGANAKTLRASDLLNYPLIYALNHSDTQATYGTQSVFIWLGDLSIY